MERPMHRSHDASLLTCRWTTSWSPGPAPLELIILLRSSGNWAAGPASVSRRRRRAASRGSEAAAWQMQTVVAEAWLHRQQQEQRKRKVAGRKHAWGWLMLRHATGKNSLETGKFRICQDVGRPCSPLPAHFSSSHKFGFVLLQQDAAL